jgi:anti-anti-sigma factor
MRALTGSPATPLRLINGVDPDPSTLAKVADQIVLDPVGVPPPGQDALPPQLTILGRTRGRVERLELSGHFGLLAGPLVHVWLAQAEIARMDVIVLDLSNVTSMDEAGFLTCLRAWGHAKRRGMRLRLVHCGGDVSRLLTLTGTSELFGALPTEEVRGLAHEYDGIGWTPILIPQVCRDQ